MKWVRHEGQGHAVISAPREGVDEFGFRTACGRDILEEADDLDIHEVKTPSDRPFGADTCGECHRVAKGWTINPTTIPEGLFAPVTPVRTVMTAEERRASVHGEKRPEPVSMQGGGASAAPRAPSGRRGALRALPDDLEGGDEPHQPGTTVEGALVVKPSKAKTKRNPDVEIDSD
jgi:hypothetical protein